MDFCGGVLGKASSRSWIYRRQLLAGELPIQAASLPAAPLTSDLLLQGLQLQVLKRCGGSTEALNTGLASLWVQVSVLQAAHPSRQLKPAVRCNHTESFQLSELKPNAICTSRTDMPSK